jgi:hypothetical protein
MNLIYETPWWLPTGIAALGIILLTNGNKRQEAKVRNAGLGVIGLAILLALLSYFLDSPREIVIKRTKALVAAVEKRDWPGMEALLHPEVSVMIWKGLKEVMERTKWAAERFDLQSVRIAGISAEKPDPGVKVALQVAADFKDVSGTITNWALEWEQTDHGWMLVRVESQGGPMIGESQITKMLGAEGK